MKQNNFKIAVFAGDGVGPEIMKEALKILKLISDKKNINLQLTEGLVGGAPTIILVSPCRIRAWNLRCKATLFCWELWAALNGRCSIIV